MPAYKHINVLTRPLLGDSTKLEVLVKKITHLGQEFGIDGDNRWGHSGVFLGSDAGTPEYYHDKGVGSHTLYLKCSSSGFYAEQPVLKVPVDLWPKFKAAIEAYNAHFSGEALHEVTKGD